MLGRQIKTLKYAGFVGGGFLVLLLLNELGCYRRRGLNHALCL